MELTSKDYESIAKKISDGHNNVEYAKGNETICIECELKTEGYVEDDYYNGTGAFVETSKNLYIENVESWNADGDETDNDFNEDELLGWVA